MIAGALLLAHREIRRFLREPSRVVGAIATPLVFWALVGGGFGGTFRAGEADYAEYFFPGVLALSVFFTAIFSTISVIEDRRAGFLQAILAAPGGPPRIPRGAVIGGKVIGCGLLASAQGMLLLGVFALAGAEISWTRAAAVFGALVLSAVPLVLAGLALAFRFDSTQGFHAVMNMLLMPAWILSGSVFPLADSSPWIRMLAKANPLTYAVAILRRALGPEAAAVDPSLPGFAPSLAVLSAFCVLLFLLARRAMERES